MSFCLLLLFLQIKKEDDDDVSMSCIFFSPSSAVRALFFLSYLKERGTSFSLSSVRHVEKIEHFQARKRTIFFFDEETTRDTTFNSLFYSLLFEDRTLTKSIIDSMIGRVTTQCEDLSRCSSEDDDHHHRDRQRRERVRERGKEERKKKHSEATRETKGSKNSYESDTFSSLS